MARLVGLLAAFAVDGVTAKAGVLGGVSALIEQRCSAGHLQLRSLMSRLAVHEGDMKDVAEFLANETAEIMEIIVADHESAVQQVADAVQAVETEDAALVAAYSHALEQDRDWQNKVEREQARIIELEEIESRKEGLEKTRDDALAARDAIKDIDLQGTLQDFACDMKTDQACLGSLQSFLELKNGMLNAMDSDRSTLEGNYARADQVYQTAVNDYLDNYYHPSVAKGEEASRANWNRRQAAGPRESAMCAAGSALVRKCEAVATYRGVIEGVEAVGSESSLSHQDRVDEWRVTKMALCVVNLLAEENYDIDDAALSKCEEDADFNQEYPFGDDQKQTHKFNGLVDKTEGKFNCAETTMSFHEGSTWEIAEPSLSDYEPVSANYNFVQSYQPKLSLEDEDAPFAPEEGLCEA